MIDVEDVSRTFDVPVELLIDPEEPIAADLSLPDVEDVPWHLDRATQPDAIVTSLDDPPVDLEWPAALKTVRKKAEPLGWEAKQGYSLGYVWGVLVDAAAGTRTSQWKQREEACLYLRMEGQPRWTFSWERYPESTAKNAGGWKFSSALHYTPGYARVRAYGNLEARRMLDVTA